jgi:hypothetical protein
VGQEANVTLFVGLRQWTYPFEVKSSIARTSIGNAKNGRLEQKLQSPRPLCG